LISWLDGNDPAGGFAVAQFIAVTRCSGNLPKLVPHLAGVLGIARTTGIRQPSRVDTHSDIKKTALITERGLSHDA
jgi:hypothetical protein